VDALPHPLARGHVEQPRELATIEQSGSASRFFGVRGTCAGSMSR
jgi:hypothetical protein